MLEARVTEPIYSHPVHPGLCLLIGEPNLALTMLLVERRSLFEDQPVGRHMFRACIDGPVKRLRPVVYALTGQAEHQVQIDIAESGLARQPEGPRSEERRVGKECRSRWSPY